MRTIRWCVVLVPFVLDVDAFSISTNSQHRPSHSSLWSSPATHSDTGEDKQSDDYHPSKTEDQLDDTKDPTPDNGTEPGSAENAKFECDPSVTFWQSFDGQDAEDNWRQVEEIVAHELQLPSRNARTNDATTTKTNATLISTESRAYWASHLLRTSYFAGNAVAGVLTYTFYNRFLLGDRTNRGDIRTSRLLDPDQSSRVVLETMLVYQQEWQHISQGWLRFPWDAAWRYNERSPTLDRNIDVQWQIWNHKQFKPNFVWSETGRLIQEAVRILERQARLEGRESPKGPSFPIQLMTRLNQRRSRAPGKEDAPDESRSLLYPDYYFNDFSYRTDGWLSSSSAARHEVLMESTYLGRHDAMERQTLVPLQKYWASLTASHRTNNQPRQILDVACGTGRFASFLRDTIPDAEVTLVDLSPFYLEKAAENDAYWREFNREFGAKPATCLQANAEALPLANESMDAVTCLSLFHQLPADARYRVAAEMARVVRPGGMIIVTDRIQLGDRKNAKDMQTHIVGMAAREWNEPHLHDYMASDLTGLMEAHGLVPHQKYVASMMKTLSFIKPPQET